MRRVCVCVYVRERERGERERERAREREREKERERKRKREMTTGKAARILSRCRVWSCPPRGRGRGLGPSQLSSPAAPAVSSASGARRARRASSPPVVLVAKGTVVASDPACAPCAHREHHSCVLSSRAHACTHPAHERAPRCCVQQQVRGAHPRTAQHHAAAWPACARVCAPRAPCAHREVHTVAEKGPAAAPACCDPRAAGLLTSACTCHLQAAAVWTTQNPVPKYVPGSG